MSGNGDDNLDPERAQDPQGSLERQNERLQLLLNLTTRITSNLDLREVLRAISANFRELMRCDGAGVWLPGQEAGTFKLYAFDSPVSKGFAKEDLIITPAEDDPGKRAFETMKATVATVEEIGWPGGGEGYRLAAAEGVKSACFIPLVSRGRALGDLMIVRKTEGTFTAADVDFLSQAAGQIAIAIENALAYREISELKDKLAQEKLYLEEEIRSEMDFEQIVGSSAALKHVLQLVETVAPNDSTVLLLGETGTGKELIVLPIRIPPLRERREDIPLLVSYFVQKFAKEMQKKIGTIPTATMKGLAAWEWPGNIRELENFIERAVILTRGESLQAPLSELRKPTTDTAPAPAAQPVQEDIARIVKESINAALNGKRPTDEYAQKQREEIVRALTECNGRVGGADGAAARMRINRTTLISRMKKLGIDPRQYAS